MFPNRYYCYFLNELPSPESYKSLSDNLEMITRSHEEIIFKDPSYGDEIIFEVSSHTFKDSANILMRA